MKDGTRKTVNSAVFSALYIVFSLFLRIVTPVGVEIRLSEALVILPVFFSEATFGLTAGCFITNIISGNIFDVIFGTLATFLGCLGTAKLKKTRFLFTLPPVAANSVILPFVYKYAYGINSPLYLTFIYFFAGEVISVCVFGFILQRIMKKYKIFGRK